MSERDNTQSQNSDIVGYLTAFVKSANFQQAVLLSGQWGAGKTHFIKEFSRQIFLGEFDKKVTYVSLYGLQDTKEIDQAVIQALYPYIDALQTPITMASSWAKGGNFKLSKYANRFSSSLYIFDDLERCLAPLNATLGYINRFVEHSDCKVIIVANEIPLYKLDSYKHEKEKLVARTLEIQSEFRAVYDQLGASASEAFRSFLDTHTRLVETMFQRSRSNNLRILKQVIWEFDRLYQALPENIVENAAGMELLFRSYLALSIDVRTGDLQAEDLTARSEYTDVLGQTPEPDTPLARLEIFDEKYEIPHHLLDLLSTPSWADLLMRSKFDVEAIVGELRRQPSFSSYSNIPSCRVFFHLWEMSDDEAAALLHRFDSDFTNRRFKSMSDSLWMFASLYFIRKLGLRENTDQEIEEYCLSYFKDILESNDFEPRSGNCTTESSRIAGRLQLSEAERKPYFELAGHLEQLRSQELERRTATWVRELTDQLKSAPAEFAARLGFGDFMEGEFVGISLLHRISVSDFAAAIDNASPSNQRLLFEMLKERFQSRPWRETSPEEVKWFEDLVDELGQAGTSNRPLSRHRLRQWTRSMLQPLVEMVRAEAMTAEQ